MPRLKPADVTRAIAAGAAGSNQKIADGASLFLFVRGRSAIWIHQYREGASMRTRSLGSAADMSPNAARRAREAFSAQRRAEPIERRGATVRRTAEPASEPQTSRYRFADVLKAYITLNSPKWKGEQEASRYGKLTASCVGSLWVDEISTADVEKHLKTLPLTTAQKDRMRIMSVLNFAKAKGYRTGDNPADQSIMKHLIPMPAKSKPHAALPLDLIPALMADLVADGSNEARALGFLILTATRTAEARDVVWSEIDTDKMLWSIPTSRMKEGVAHDVPLSAAALALLGKPMGAGRVFGALAYDALIDKLQELRGNGYTAHGMRSAFTGWAVKRGYSKDLRDRALAHAVGNATDAAYDRETLIEERRPMMQAWADFACGTKV